MQNSDDLALVVKRNGDLALVIKRQQRAWRISAYYCFYLFILFGAIVAGADYVFFFFTFFLVFSACV